MDKRLPVGIDDFEKVIKGNYYYVDKSLLIKEIVEQGNEVSLFLRPRRFGKSLNMSMLKYFFETGTDSSLFDGLAISEKREICDAYFGKYPVIFLSLKGVDGMDYRGAADALRTIVGREADRFSYLIDSDKLSLNDKSDYKKLTERRTDAGGIYAMSDEILGEALYTLTALLYKHFNRKPIVLIDEYDVPLDKAHTHGYYDEMTALIRNMFSAALKSNTNLSFAVMTGCLRISKESIFTGFNNLAVFSISSADCDDYFGFTEPETRKLLASYGLSDKAGNVKEWYDGYRFGTVDMYCPWDVLNFCRDHMSSHEGFPDNYWMNSSSNDLVREFVNISTERTAGELEALVNGKKLEKNINENLTYRDIDGSIENLWSVLYMTGYLTGKSLGGGMYSLWIPNKEVQMIYEKNIITWFNDRVRRDTESGLTFYNAALSGDPVTMAKVLNSLLRRSVSIRDTFTNKNIRENFYHGFILGLLTQFDGIESNPESGNGYSDVMIVNDISKAAAIFELKYSESGENEIMEKSCDDALVQIEELGYDESLILSGISKIWKYGISFNRKKACVKKKEGI